MIAVKPFTKYKNCNKFVIKNLNEIYLFLFLNLRRKMKNLLNFL